MIGLPTTVIIDETGEAYNWPIWTSPSSALTDVVLAAG